MNVIQLKATQETAGNLPVVFLVGKEATDHLPQWIQNNALYKAKADKSENSVLTLCEGDQTAVVTIFNKVEESLSLALEDVRRLGAQVTPLLNQYEFEKASVDVAAGFDAYASAFVEGVLLTNYQYLQFKSEKKDNPIKALDVKSSLSQADLDEIANVVEAVFMARDLVNEPVITLNATAFSKAMAKGGEKAGYETTVLEKHQIEALKMGGLLGVNYGSIDPPTFNILEWKPENAVNEKPLVLVGKGVVYDTGGNNLKPGGYMASMKCDMGGGAGVTGAIYAIAKNKLPVYTVALIPATDNRIGKNALVADDVITMSDGTTVEVKNTDAEGRLILADALVYARKYDPMLVVDMATLTGAADAITGHFGIAMTQAAKGEYVDQLKSVGDNVYERIAELPFWREYDELLKSTIADISNLGGPKGGATTAGKFLHHFTKYDWIHLDIAGPAFLDAAKNYHPVGGTGVGVRLMYAWAKALADKKGA